MVMVGMADIRLIRRTYTRVPFTELPFRELPVMNAEGLLFFEENISETAVFSIFNSTYLEKKLNAFCLCFLLLVICSSVF